MCRNILASSIYVVCAHRIFMNGHNTLLYNRMENFIQKQQKMSNQVCFWCAIIWEWGVPGHDEISKVQAYGGEILVIPEPIMPWTYFVILQIFFFLILDCIFCLRKIALLWDLCSYLWKQIYIWFSVF